MDSLRWEGSNDERRGGVLPRPPESPSIDKRETPGNWACSLFLGAQAQWTRRRNIAPTEGRPLGDVGQDCDTDLEDHALFQQGFTGPPAHPTVVIDTVLVGNEGNAADTRFTTPGYGGVAYAYNIGKYEVTAGQYTEFLNAVAATDTYGLYNPSMDSNSKGCQITQSGSSGSYTYDFSGRQSGTEADWLDRPVNYVSWGDAARFANWLHNGQPTGAQDLSTTEDGSYLLDGANSNPELMAFEREPDATWVIPSEDEWYKAAYYDGGSGAYYDYPTSRDGVPSNDLIDPDPGNSATFESGGATIGGPYFRTEVGAHENSDSPYDTSTRGEMCGSGTKPESSVSIVVSAAGRSATPSTACTRRPPPSSPRRGSRTSTRAPVSPTFLERAAITLPAFGGVGVPGRTTR